MRLNSHKLFPGKNLIILNELHVRHMISTTKHAYLMFIKKLYFYFTFYLIPQLRCQCRPLVQQFFVFCSHCLIFLESQSSRNNHKNYRSCVEHLFFILDCFSWEKFFQNVHFFESVCLNVSADCGCNSKTSLFTLKFGHRSNFDDLFLDEGDMLGFLKRKKK